MITLSPRQKIYVEHIRKLEQVLELTNLGDHVEHVYDFWQEMAEDAYREMTSEKKNRYS